MMRGMQNRPSFESIYIQMAGLIALRSTCSRMQVGCVITSIDYRKVIALGFNANAAGLPNCCDTTGIEAAGKCGCLHAEENAVINCDVPRNTEKVVFCTHLPCVMCAKRLINVGGVKRVIYKADYRLKDALTLFDTVGIDHTQLDIATTNVAVATVASASTTTETEIEEAV